MYRAICSCLISQCFLNSNNMCVLCGHQPLTPEHKLCCWSIKLVRYSNIHDNPDVWVVNEHHNNNMYHRQEILENHKIMDLASRVKVEFLGVYVRTAPQKIFAAHCKSSSNFRIIQRLHELQVPMYQHICNKYRKSFLKNALLL